LRETNLKSATAKSQSKRWEQKEKEKVENDFADRGIKHPESRQKEKV